jgi:transposase
MPAAIHRLIPRTGSPSALRCTHCDKIAADLAQTRAKLERSETANAGLRTQLVHSTAEHTAALQTISDLQARVAELERSAKLNSENSSKPPSSDGIAKPERKIRPASQRSHEKRKPSGGQIGHAGATLQQVKNPNRTIDHFPLRCDGCGAKLKRSSANGYAARQVVDLPDPRPLEVTEHRAHACRCGCGAVTKAEFPRGVGAPVQYGERVRGYAIYLNGVRLVPEARVAQTMNDLFGMTISAPTVADIVARKANALAGFMEETVLREALAAPVKHMDETGLRVNKKLLWLHVVCTPTLTHYRVGSRGEMLCGVSGIVVHDFYKSYYTLKDVVHALCGAHLLREQQALVDIDNETWAGRMQAVLRRACHATNIARRMLKRMAGTDEMTAAEKLALTTARAKVMRRMTSIAARVERLYDAIVAEAIAHHERLPTFGKPMLRKDGTPSKRLAAKRIGHNLAIRMRDHKAEVLRFVHDLSVPFSNNLAEQAMRMMKVKAKISGCFRSLAGAKRFATLRGFISTARKRCWSIIESLALDTEALVLRFASA